MTKKPTGQDILEAAYELSTPADNIDYYAQFAPFYDTDFVEHWDISIQSRLLNPTAGLPRQLMFQSPISVAEPAWLQPNWEFNARPEDQPRRDRRSKHLLQGGP